MFKESRRKIVVSIMSVLVILWVGTLGVIYASSYYEMSKRNENLLKAHAQMYTISQSITDIPQRPPVPNGDFEPKFNESPMFQLSTFYTVALSYNGKTLEIKNSQTKLHSDNELVQLAEKIVNSNREMGKEDNLWYYSCDKGGYVLVTFMDNTVMNENAITLFRYTLIFGGLALVAFFFLSRFLARKIVEPLEESYKKQKQFISDAGHELKTPVSVVNANAEMLSREIGENQWLQNILYENERMGILVGQLLELARTENVQMQMETIDFSRLVCGEELPFESVAFEKGLQLCCNIENGVTIEGNTSQLKQLVSILLDNSIRHSESGGNVYLNMNKENDHIKLSVINKGEEIPQEQREQLFERFYRADTVRNGDDKHYGLGLAIAKAIVTSHNGKIDVLCYNGFVEFRVMFPT